MWHQTTDWTTFHAIYRISPCFWVFFDQKSLVSSFSAGWSPNIYKMKTFLQIMFIITKIHQIKVCSLVSEKKSILPLPLILMIISKSPVFARGRGKMDLFSKTSEHIFIWCILAIMNIIWREFSISFIFGDQPAQKLTWEKSG